MSKGIAKLIYYLFSVLATFCGVSLHAADTIDPARVKEIAAMISPTPTGFGQPITNRAAWTQVADDSALKPILSEAEKMAAQPDPDLPDDLYLDCSRTGNRDRAQKVMFDRSSRLAVFTLAECLENKGRFLKPLQKTIEVICAEKAWPYPAHDLPLTVFHGQEMKPDLRATTLASDLATADYLLGDKLPVATHRLLRENIRRRVLEPFRETVAGLNNQAHWLRIRNNWNAVCLAGTTGAALVIEDSPEERAWFIAAAEHYIENFLSGFSEDGYCSEGVGYWNYGFGHFVILTEEIRDATQGKLDLFSLPEVDMPARFGSRCEIINHIYPSIADVSPGAKPDPQIVRYASQRLGLPADADQRYPKALDTRNLAAAVFQLFAPDVWPATKSKAKELKDSPLRTWFYDAGVLIARPKPGGKPFAVVLKGGTNTENHNHIDKGSFSVVSGGSMVICDPGAEAYTRRTFSAHRYDSGVLNSFGHAVPVIAEKMETTRPTGHAVIMSTHFSEDEDAVVFDLREAYEVTDLKKLERAFLYHRGDAPSLRVTDTVEFDNPEQFESALITWGDWKQISTSEFEIADDEGKVTVTVDAGSVPFTIHKTEIDEHVHTPRKPVHIGIVLSQPVKDAKVSLLIKPVFGKD